MRQHSGSNDVQFAQEKRDDGQLEHQAHHQGQGGEGADVGFQGDVGRHHA